jgi:hypothetical protein
VKGSHFTWTLSETEWPILVLSMAFMDLYSRMNTVLGVDESVGLCVVLLDAASVSY